METARDTVLRESPLCPGPRAGGKRLEKRREELERHIAADAIAVEAAVGDDALARLDLRALPLVGYYLDRARRELEKGEPVERA